VKFLISALVVIVVFGAGMYIGVAGLPRLTAQNQGRSVADRSLQSENIAHALYRHRRHWHGPVTHPSPTVSASASPTVAPSTPAPTAAPTATATATGCSGASGTPGGPDPWGGCWPGANNTGVPAGTALTAYHGSCEIKGSNVVIDAQSMDCGVVITGDNVTIKDTMINGTVQNNGNGKVLIEDTTINGGSDQSESVLGSNLTILRANLFGDQHEIYCGDDCTVQDSWLHDNFNGLAAGWHQNGFLSTGGSGYDLVHNSVGCVGGCTSDITFIPNDNISNAVVSKNLLVAAPTAAYCLYPSSDHPGKPGNVSQMTVTDNVFQHGANGKCATYGPVYGWDDPTSSAGSDGFDNVWIGNTWAGGATIQP
jgi:type II secretory pathway pseudopilin PulG